MISSSEGKLSTMWGPWKLFRVVFKGILYGAAAWFLLALLWAFLPSPMTEHDGDNGIDYPTAIIRSGKVLTRVYDSNHLNAFRVQQNDRQGFALDYKLDLHNLTLSIGEHALPIIYDQVKPDSSGPITKQMDVIARIGDADGANLPWFPFADSVLLFWWIHKEDLSLPISVKWSREANGLHKMEIHAAHPRNGLLLTIEIRGPDPSAISVSTPEFPFSSSPSITYPVRVAIIHIIAPTAVFVNDLLGNAFGAIIESMVTAIFIVLVVVLYGFLILAVVFSLWRCFKGPSYEDTVTGIQGRLEKLSQNERLRYLKIDALREKLELLFQDERFKVAVDICRNGWHPERDRAMAAEKEEADMEKGLKAIDESEEAKYRDDPSSKQ